MENTLKEQKEQLRAQAKNKKKEMSCNCSKVDMVHYMGFQSYG